MSQTGWQRVAKEHQGRRASSIPERWLIPQDDALQMPRRVVSSLLRWLSPEEIEITAQCASVIAARLRSGQYTCLQVTEAFCHRAAIAHQLTNCLTEIFFNEALEQARFLDAELARTGQTIGPLHGVPVSVKDHYNIKGHYTTAGYIAYAQNPVKESDAHIVDILREAGAVLYAKTNNPQCMMVLETVSNIYGRTLNPWNTELGAGGSSGGEGALLALHGSCLGLGSDIGGSIRVPAAFNGLYGFKPSGGRVPTSGWECTMSGSESIPAVAGPLGHSVEDIELFFQVVSNAQPWLREPLLYQPWKPHIASQSDLLSIGIMIWDEVVLPHPYITRVIKDVADKLRSAGHDVIDFQPHDHKRAWDDILLPLYFTDGGLDIRQTLAMGNEPMVPCARQLLEDPIVRERSIGEVWKLNIARDKYRMGYLQKWAETSQATRSKKPIDVLICPVAPLQGTPHDVKPWWGYCAQWNLLDYPSGVIPAGKVLEDDSYAVGYQPVNDLDRENMELFDVERYCGMPVAIQVVGPRQQDEKVVGAMKTIDSIINHQ